MKRFLILLMPALLWGACTLDRSGFDPGEQASSGDSETNGGSQGSGGDLFTGSTGEGGSTTSAGAPQGGNGAQGGTDAQGGMGGKLEGDPCLNNEDCSDTTAVCDPQQGLCDRNFQCNALNTCGTGEMCFDQAPSGQHGACYTSCKPFSTSCAAGQTCVDPEGYGENGICMHNGTAGHGQSCTQHDINTDCIAGHGCYSYQSNTFCLELCNFWGNGTCTTGNELCYQFGACAIFGVDPASIGSSCNGGNQGVGCALDGEVVRGICTGQPAICRQWCRLGGTDCGEGTCTPFFSNLGICTGS